MASCHGCTQSFGFLSKEVGCPNCGFSYCKKCLKFKLTDEEAQTLGKINPKSKVIAGTSVCRSCYDKVSSKDLKSPTIKNAANLIRNLHRLESLENPAKPPITLYCETSSSRLMQLKAGLSEADQKIVERLEELRGGGNKGRRKSEQMDEDVEARLARLRGEDPTLRSISSKDVLKTQKPETESDLMNRLGQQVNLDKQYNQGLVGDIEERLAKLRPNAPMAQNATAPASASNHELDGIVMSDDDDDEGLTEQEQVQRLINRFVAEVALEGKPDHTSATAGDEDEGAMDIEIDDDDDDDDKYCELCNENRATLKCNSCDGDIFCKKCFHEFHVEIGELHKPTPL